MKENYIEKDLIEEFSLLLYKSSVDFFTEKEKKHLLNGIDKNDVMNIITIGSLETLFSIMQLISSSEDKEYIKKVDAFIQSIKKIIEDSSFINSLRSSENK